MKEELTKDVFDPSEVNKMILMANQMSHESDKLVVKLHAAIEQPKICKPYLYEVISTFDNHNNRIISVYLTKCKKWSQENLTTEQYKQLSLVTKVLAKIKKSNEEIIQIAKNYLSDNITKSNGFDLISNDIVMH